MTEILLLGTFHFRESAFDFSSDEVQEQLDSLTQKLADFKPDAVAVELAVREQALVSKSYQKFELTDLKNGDKVRNGNLGEIVMFGEKRQIRYDRESVQIGYKLGKMCNLDDIYAVDDDSDVMGNAGKLLPFLTDSLGAMESDMKLHKEDSILDLYKHFNSAEWSKLNHTIYIRCNEIQIDHEYTGSELVAKWYERNLKIFSNIQQVAEKCKRLFVIYGAGHLQILRELIHADSKLKLVDVYEYL